MKKYIVYSLLTVFALSFVSCNEFENLDPTSVITESAGLTNRTALDDWLEANYVDPYNIWFKYRYQDILSDVNYYEVPADYDAAVKMAHLLKYLCLEAYDEVAGVHFTRNYFPKEIFLTGEWDYRNNGTIILATAEGGKKIFLKGLNFLESYLGSAENMNRYYFKTIHHEFTHILNQTKPYTTDFDQVTGSLYVSDEWSEEPYNTTYASRGFVSAYAQMEAREDFAETMSIYITNPQSSWDSLLESAGDAAPYIRKKFEIVYDYMLDSWGIDLNELRAAILRRQADVIAGNLDLTDVTVK